MMEKIRFRPVGIFAGFVVAGVMLWGTVVHADVIIYSDGFNRIGALNGSTPDVTLGQYGGTAGATWISAPWNTDGAAVVTNPSQGAATLPFTPQTGHLYQISVTENNTSGNSEWLALGYSDGTGGGSTFYHAEVTPKAWMLMRGTTATFQNQSFYGSGTTNPASIGTETGTNTIAINLDTRPANWQINWYVNSNLVRTATFATNPTITSVSFGNDNMAGIPVQGTFENFTLAVVPEPGTLALVAFGSLAVMHRRRKNSK